MSVGIIDSMDQTMTGCSHEQHQQQEQQHDVRCEQELHPQSFQDEWWHSDNSEEGDIDPNVEPDPLYDPNADDMDERWTAQQRQGRVTDAILSCPACFTTLCIDCQKHATVHTQFRAMFVMNCVVDSSHPQYADQPHSRQKKKSTRKREALGPPCDLLESSQHNVVYPVSCEACGTVVGVRDKEEVYHFYHVYPSNG